MHRPALSRRSLLHGVQNAEVRPGMSRAARRPSVASHAETRSADPAVNIPSRNPGVAMPPSPMPIPEALKKIVRRISLPPEKRTGG